ncbi:1-phosphofructokinase [Bacillus taeanensis]|uniref:1-phosphofructokinase n=1 Tax=Bacillus taeanensis TaxID=273032 RepID=A0A366Y3L8_9BACI|nr:1-phosphofructokinase [Bacillus taeanensis]RBW71003.1 1-phosphofructokinase [Bacillus taeanensis]
MIYTCTLNPSVDYLVQADKIQIGELNRIENEMKIPGGKGINVSRVLKRMNVESKALGFIGGFTGEFVRDALKAEYIGCNFVSVSGDTRINVKLKADKETEINADGPIILAEELEQLMEKLDALTPEDILVLAGSIPKSLPSSLYKQIMEHVQHKNVKVVVDTTGQTLLDVLPLKPFLVKPNHHELGELFNVTIETVEEAIPYGRKLVEMGAENVIVSMAGMGALFFTKNSVHYANVPSGELKNSVGAGDSVVAGFIGSYVKKGSLLHAFKYGVTAGSASAFSIGFCTEEYIQTLINQVKIREINEGAAVTS